MRETEAGRAERGLLLALAVDPGSFASNFGLIKRDDVPALTVALERAIYAGVDLVASTWCGGHQPLRSAPTVGAS